MGYHGAAMARRLEGWRVLVIDGDAQVRDVIRAALEMEGAAVTTAARAADALAGLKRGRLEAVVADTDVADAPGEALYLAVRARDRKLASRMVFLARDTQAPEARGLRRRAAVVLPKPLALSELVAALVGLGS